MFNLGNLYFFDELSGVDAFEVNRKRSKKNDDCHQDEARGKRSEACTSSEEKEEPFPMGKDRSEKPEALQGWLHDWTTLRIRSHRHLLIKCGYIVENYGKC